MPSGNPDSAIPYTLEKVKAEAAASEWMTIVGFGSLLSEKSARVTCPNLKDFKLARIQGYRRVFTHPAALFFERGIAVPGTLEISSLSTEPHEGAGFVAATFDAPAAEVPALMEREEEFDFVKVPFFSIDNGAELGSGLMCTRSTDAEVFQNRNLLPKYQQLLGPHFRQISVWGWGPDSGILPCPVYCRHCVLAVTAPGIPAAAGDSFLDETFLADRQTTLREYIASCPQLMDVQPPESLRGRYSG